MADEFDIDIQKVGAIIKIDPTKKQGVYRVYITQGPCGTPNPDYTNGCPPPTHVVVQYPDGVDVVPEEEQ